MNLPQIKNEDQDLQLMQSRWASILNPLLAKPLSNANILKNISIITGSNVINHLLSRTMQGWIISDIDAPAQIYKGEPFNDKTLTLISDADCVINLVVY